MKYIFLLLFPFLLFSCKTNQSPSNGNSGQCKTRATVKDFTGLDGCRFLLILENGDKLLPGEMPDENFSFVDGQKVKINYKKLEGQMSICMAEDAIVKITCIELAD